MSKKNEMAIEDLPGIGAATAEKLREAGYHDLMGIAVATPGELTESVGMGEASARKVINSARNNLDMGFVSGEDLLKKREQIIRIKTGSTAFDELVNGGFESGGITECYGQFGSGKSALAHQLAINALYINEEGDPTAYAVWIDSENTFRPERVKQICENTGLDAGKVLRNIKVVRAYNSDHQMMCAEKVEDLIQKEGLDVKMIIVDSLMTHFRSEFIGRGTLSNRQQKINKHMHTLMKMADQYNLAVYVTNQVMAKPDTFFGDPTAAIGGNIVGHNCLTPDTFIQMADGDIVPLFEIFEKEKILSADLCGNMKIQKSSIGTVVVKKGFDKMYEISAASQIRCSEGHRFFTIEGFNIVEKEAKDLYEGEFLAQPIAYEVKGAVQTLPEVKVKQLVRFEQEATNIVLNSNIGTRQQICQTLTITPRQFRRVLNQGYPTNEENVGNLISIGVPEEIQNHVIPCYTNNHKPIEMPKTLSPELAEMMGYFIGDGNFEERGLRFKDERLSVLEHQAKLYKEVFNKAARIRKSNSKNCYIMDVNSSEIRELFFQMQHKMVNYVAKSPKEQVQAFIRGFVDADGSVDKNSPTISASQRDEYVLRQVQLLLQRLGIRSRMRKQIVEDNPIHHLTIADADSILEYISQIGMSAPDKKERLENIKAHCEKSFTQVMSPIKREDLWKYIKSIGKLPSKFIRPRPKNKAYKFVGLRELKSCIEKLESEGLDSKKLDFMKDLVQGDLQFERIGKIKTKDAKDQIFIDFSVPGFENYIANGFLVHNSQTRIYLRRGKKGTRVAKLVDSPYLPDGECVFQINDKGIQDV
jgi:DNA repair protein RadA